MFFFPEYRLQNKRKQKIKKTFDCNSIRFSKNEGGINSTKTQKFWSIFHQKLCHLSFAKFIFFIKINKNHIFRHHKSLQICEKSMFFRFFLIFSIFLMTFIIPKIKFLLKICIFCSYFCCILQL